MEKAGRESISLGQIIFALLLFLAVVGVAVTMFFVLSDRVSDYLNDKNSQVEATALNSFRDLDCQEYVLMTTVINTLHENGSVIDCITFDGARYATPDVNVANATVVESPAETVLPLLLNYTDKRCLVELEIVDECSILYIKDLREV